jgi:hypothetical protein
MHFITTNPLSKNMKEEREKRPIVINAMTQGREKKTITSNAASQSMNEGRK